MRLRRPSVAMLCQGNYNNVFKKHISPNLSSSIKITCALRKDNEM